MSIDQEKVIDIISEDKKNNEISLVVTDHLDWDEENIEDHLHKLQNKLNTYLAFIEGGELLEQRPNSQGKRIIINIIGMYPLVEIAEQFYDISSKKIKEAGFDLKFTLTETK